MFDNLRRWWKSDKSGKRPARKNPVRQWSFRPTLQRLEDRWVPSAPTVTGVSPNYGPVGGGTEVAITGSGFTSATQVNFGSASTEEFDVVNDSTIDVNAPGVWSAGIVNVTVTNPDGTSATSSADQYAYGGPAVAPAVTSVTPNSGPLSGETEVVIDGSGFSSATAVYFGAAEAEFSVESASVIDVYSPSASTAGTVDVTVVNPFGTSSTSSADQFSYVAPLAITSISPGGGPTTGDTLALINGSGFTGATGVTFGGVSAPSYQVLSDTEILATSPAFTSPYDVQVQVTTPYGASASSSGDGFQYADSTTPTVTSISPNSGPTGGETEVQINGSDFTGATAVDFGSVPALNYCVEADNLILAWSPAETTGVTDVTVTTSYGTSATSSADQFTYVPSVTAVTPASGPTAGGTAVVIDGRGFTDAPAVKFGGTAASFTVVSDTVIDATAPAGSLGVVDITVATASGTSATSSADQFTYALASSTTLSTSENPANYGDSVTFTAVVGGRGAGTPTGTVTFMDGTTELGTGTLDGTGTATYTTSSLALGVHSITAVYGGDSNYASSTLPALTENVTSPTAYVWTGADPNDPNDWNDPGDWLVNGVQPSVAPGQYDDVLFSGQVGSDIDCETPDGEPVAVQSLTIDSTYTGTLTANDELNVSGGGLSMAGGDLETPGTTIYVTNGTILLAGGILNAGATPGMLYAANATIQLTGPARNIGTSVVVDDAAAVLNMTGDLTFTNNAGIKMKNAAHFDWQSATNIVTTGTGIIENDGGTFAIDVGTQQKGHVRPALRQRRRNPGCPDGDGGV